MNRSLILAATLLMAPVTAPPEAAHAAEPQPARATIGRFVGTPLVAAQRAFQQMDYALALAKGEEADAVTNKTNYEEFHVTRLLGIAHLRVGNFAAAIEAYDRAITTGVVPPEQAEAIAREREEASARLGN